MEDVSKLDNQLLEAVDKCDLDGVKKALETGANPNAKDEYCDTVLIHAVERANEKLAMELTKLLLENGADATIVNDQGKTALIIASNAEVINLLKNPK